MLPLLSSPLCTFFLLSSPRSWRRPPYMLCFTPQLVAAGYGAQVDTPLQWLHTESRPLALWLGLWSRRCQRQEPATLGPPEPRMSSTRAGQSVVSHRNRTDALRNESAYP